MGTTKKAIKAKTKTAKLAKVTPVSDAKKKAKPSQSQEITDEKLIQEIQKHFKPLSEWLNGISKKYGPAYACKAARAIALTIMDPAPQALKASVAVTLLEQCAERASA